MLPLLSGASSIRFPAHAAVPGNRDPGHKLITARLIRDIRRIRGIEVVATHFVVGAL
jgi:hypothetical protein